MHLSSVQKLATSDDPHVIDGNTGAITEYLGAKGRTSWHDLRWNLPLVHRTASKSRVDSNEGRSLTHHCKSLRGLRLQRNSVCRRERPESFFSSRPIRFSVAQWVR